MNINEEYAKQKELLDWSDNRFKIPFKTDDRSRVYLSCYDLVIEHYAAILVLFESGLRGSMFALLRIQFEALVRAQYFNYAATEQDWKNFLKDKDITKNFGEMIAAVEVTIGEDSGVLSKFKSDSYRMMNSFTHTGYQHIVRRNDGEQVGAVNYSDIEVAQTLRCAGALAMMAFAGLAELSNDNEFIGAYFEKLAEYSLKED